MAENHRILQRPQGQPRGKNTFRLPKNPLPYHIRAAEMPFCATSTRLVIRKWWMEDDFYKEAILKEKTELS